MMRLWLEISFMVFWICMFIVRYPFAQRNKKNSITADKKDGIEKITLALTALSMMILPAVYVATPWLDFADYHLPNYWGILGIVLLSPTSILFYRSHKDLGRNWSATLEVHQEHTLVTTGVYKYIRHPMYTAIWLWVICQALLLQNFIVGLSGMLSFGLLYILRVGKEEKMMEGQFGEKYVAYKGRTKRLVPGII
ncbi:MAG: protein-S-isoprenylcysteine O-methyltransferase [Bacteroidota bacterium]